MEYIKTLIHGMLLGIANAIPGVSGGTMAVVLNIYDKIMYALSLKNIKGNLKFLIPLGIGAVLGVFLLSNVIVSAMENYPMGLGRKSKKFTEQIHIWPKRKKLKYVEVVRKG